MNYLTAKTLRKKHCLTSRDWLFLNVDFCIAKISVKLYKCEQMDFGGLEMYRNPYFTGLIK